MRVLIGPISEININAGSSALEEDVKKPKPWCHGAQDIGHNPQSLWPWTLTQNDGQHSPTAPLPRPAPPPSSTNNWVFHCQNVGKELKGASGGSAGRSCRSIWQSHQLSKTTTAKVDLQRFRGQRSMANKLQRCTSGAEKIEYRGASHIESPRKPLRRPLWCRGFAAFTYALVGIICAYWR